MTLPELHCTYAVLYICCAWLCTCLVTTWPCLVVTTLLAELGFTGPALSLLARDGGTALLPLGPASAASLPPLLQAPKINGWGQSNLPVFLLIAFPTPRKATLSLWLLLGTCLSMCRIQLSCVEILLILLLSLLLGSIFELTLRQAAQSR